MACATPASKRLRVVLGGEEVPSTPCNWVYFMVQKREDFDKDQSEGNKKVYVERNSFWLQTNLKADIVEIDMEQLQSLKKEINAGIKALKKKRTFEVVKTYID